MNSTATLLQSLIRFDTSNPPGNEKACIFFIKEILENKGFDVTLYGKYEDRPNLIARLKGKGEAPPFLLYGHADVVPAKGEGWTHPPFSGIIREGSIWGRGALDMKGGLSMMIGALLRIVEKKVQPESDILFAVFCDEEAGSDAGAKYVTEQYPLLFEGVKYALGEFGGFPFYVGKKKFYPVQIGEKQICWMKGKIIGKSGHAAHRVSGTAAIKMGRVLTSLGKKRLPVHVTGIAENMIRLMAENLPVYQGVYLKMILNPVFTDLLLTLLGERGELFDPILHNNVNVTILNGGDKINMIPREITFQMDGRILPGYTATDLIREIKDLTGVDMDMELTRYEPNLFQPDLALFDMLSDILKDQDPGCVPVPFLLPGITDGRFFSKLGIQTYGFIPMNLPRGFDFSGLVHSENERIPVDSLDFGVDAIYQAILRYGEVAYKID